MIRRPTLRDIAKIAGVTFATVSYALRNHPRISMATRRKIQLVAKKIGYRPDPMLSAMAVYRQSIKPSKYRGVLGWIENHPTRDGCKKIIAFNDYFLGASKRAEELGYTLETFWMREPGLTRQRISNILISRNILGLLVAPQPRGRARLRLKWQNFSVVAIGHSLVRPQFHVVSGNQYLAMVKTMRQLYALGYRRIGFVSTKLHSEMVAHNLLASFLMEQRRFKVDDRIPALPLNAIKRGISPSKSEPEFLQWYDRYKPQVIITTLPEIFDMLKKMKQRVPRDVGLAIPNMPNCLEKFSGINMNARLIGKVAVDFLISMIHRHEKGIPSIPQRLSIGGTWFLGKTVRHMNVY